jgi:hypothetical protein
MMRNFDRLKVTLFGKFRPHNTKVSLLTWLFRSTVEGYAKFSPANSKWTKHTVAEHVSLGGNGPLFVGTPSQVADSLQVWIDEADVDGFNFVSPYTCRLEPLLTMGRDMSCSLAHSKILSNYYFLNFDHGDFSGMITRCPVVATERISMAYLVRSILLRSILLPSTGGLLAYPQANIRFHSRSAGYSLKSS